MIDARFFIKLRSFEGWSLLSVTVIVRDSLSLVAVSLIIRAALKQIGEPIACPSFRRVPDSTVAVFVSRPSQLLLIVPGKKERRIFIIPEQVPRFVQQHCRALAIVDR